MARTHKILTVLLLSTASAAASPPAPPPDSAVAKELLELRGALLGHPRAKPPANPEKFRALCDKDGYPLVGNVANKGDRYQPSQLCGTLRAAKRT